MSFLISALLETKAVIAGDKMITWPDGRSEVIADIKFGQLPSGFILGWSGNSVVSWKMVQTFSKLVENEIENFSGFEKKLSIFKESFDPIYDGIEKDILQVSGGSGQLQGIGLVGKRLTVVSVNYVPSQSDFKVMVTQKPGNVTTSSPDGNSKILEFWPAMVEEVLNSENLSNRQIRKLFKKIYRKLSEFDSTVSKCGHLLILRPSGKEKEFSF